MEVVKVVNVGMVDVLENVRLSDDTAHDAYVTPGVLNDSNLPAMDAQLSSHVETEVIYRGHGGYCGTSWQLSERRCRRRM